MKAKKIILALVLLTCMVLSSLLSCRKVSPSDMNLKGGVNTSSNLKANTATGDEFSIVIIPDPQYYTAEKDVTDRDANQQMFKDQINWILANKTTENIAYVACVGDETNGGDQTSGNPYLADEWINASSNGGFYSLDNVIPYGVAVGNHDMLPAADPLHATLTHFNQYFGPSHFTGKLGYQASANLSGIASTTDNSNHYDFFTAGGLDFIVIYIVYDNDPATLAEGVYNWADNLLSTYPNRKAIVVTHWAGCGDGCPAPPTAVLSTQGTRILNKLRAHSNFFLMIGGHLTGETSRWDTYQGKTVKTYVVDYQSKKDTLRNWDGGAGYLRVMKFSVSKDLISARSFSPYVINHPSFPAYPELLAPQSKFTAPLFRIESAMRKWDFNQDGTSEPAMYNNATSSSWKIYGMTDVPYGKAGDVPIPADYDGDGKTDVSVYRPSTREFCIIGQPAFAYGNTGDIPVPADYDADGKANVAVWRPSNGTWYVKDGSTTVFGQSGDIPIPGDYDGNGFVQPAVYRPSNKTFYRLGLATVPYGNAGDIPVPGDYNGDGITEIAVYRPSTGHWYNYNLSTDITLGGTAGDIPVPGDYFGAGKMQPAIYRPSNHTFYLYNNGVTTTIAMGASTDKVVNLPYPVKNAFFPGY